MTNVVGTRAMVGIGTAQNGIARAIYPSHTGVDGDAIFATGQINSEVRVSVDVLGSAAAEAVELAILDAVAKAGIMRTY